MSTLNLISHRLLVAAVSQPDPTVRRFVTREMPELFEEPRETPLSFELVQEGSALPPVTARPLRTCCLPLR